MASSSLKSLAVWCWNVRGLGDPAKCRDVKRALMSDVMSIFAAQETKLSNFDSFKASTFLPPNLLSYSTKLSDGGSGGILTSWRDSEVELISSRVDDFSLTNKFSFQVADLSFTITNVYGPCDHNTKYLFLEELKTLSDVVVLGDFNLTQDPADRSNDNFDSREADMFNNFISSSQLQELPLLDRLYTWSNNQSTSTLVRLDRALVNNDWSLAFPDSTLTSRVRTTSDHVPLVLKASTAIPKSTLFRFNNHWLLSPDYIPIIQQNWNSVYPNSSQGNTAALCSA